MIPQREGNGSRWFRRGCGYVVLAAFVAMQDVVALVIGYRRAANAQWMKSHTGLSASLGVHAPLAG
jgi:hypothetical protein